MSPLKGEVFANANGMVSFLIPSEGGIVPGSIPFNLTGEMHEVPDGPEWAWILIAGEPCLINPHICAAPYWRLADCVNVAHRCRDKIPSLEDHMVFAITMPPLPHPNAQGFCFSRTATGTICIDTEERIRRYEIVPPTDGQNRMRKDHK